MTSFAHQTVLLTETVSLIAPGASKVIVDGTLGAGGHAEALLSAGAIVVGLDRDPRALAAAGARLSRFGDRFIPRRAAFAEAPRIVMELGLAGVDGLLLDLGVSSPQLDEAERGFSFQTQGPLDMRMADEGETAAMLIDRLSEEELADVLYQLGEEPFSRKIARALKAAAPTTTSAAVEAVKSSVPRKAWPKAIHVATRTFQALRIAVNDELGQLAVILKALPELLRKGGVAAVISFHSLEDRAVKEAFKDLVGRCTCPPGLPVCACGAQGNFALRTKKAVVASAEERDQNPRSRSARLRAVEKIQ